MTRIAVDIHDAAVRELVDRVMLALRPEVLRDFLIDDVRPYMQDEIVARFAFEGDDASGDWPRLSDATQNIRAHAGFGPDSPINERTGQLVEYLVANWDTFVDPIGANLVIPGEAQGSMEAKIRHAQVGSPAGENPLFPNSSTPPRPVLALDEENLVAVMEMIEAHLMFSVGI